MAKSKVKEVVSPEVEDTTGEEIIVEQSETGTGIKEVEQMEVGEESKKSSAPMEKAPIKVQKIRTLEDVDCIIGGKKYTIGKDKTAEVPTDVAAILTYARQAYRL